MVSPSTSELSFAKMRAFFPSRSGRLFVDQFDRTTVEISAL